MMLKKTERDYFSIARHFLGKHAEKISLENIDRLLIIEAGNYQKNYWYRLRRALEVSFERKGHLEVAHRLKALHYPDIPRKIKKRRVHTVSSSDHRMLIEACRERDDYSLSAALSLCWLFGCRPAELLSIKLIGETTVLITGAKKTEDNKRGLDREIKFPEKYHELVKTSISNLHTEMDKNNSQSHAIKRLQRRLETATRRLWPKRKSQITFYSYRHQLGSNFKGCGDISRQELAAIMGHQSVNSADKYGDSRSAKGGINIQASDQSVNSVRVKVLKREGYQAYLINKGVRKSSNKSKSYRDKNNM